jgi:hypothetical protein
MAKPAIISPRDEEIDTDMPIKIRIGWMMWALSHKSFVNDTPSAAKRNPCI